MFREQKFREQKFRAQKFRERRRILGSMAILFSGEGVETPARERGYVTLRILTMRCRPQ